jgi:hypothetical protein
MIALGQDIAAAFADSATSDEVACVLAAVEEAAQVAKVAAEAARLAALNPLVADVAAAKAAMDDALFRRDRLNEAARQLTEREGMLRKLEASNRRQAELTRLLTERADLERELGEMSGAIMRIANLVVRLDASDREIKAVGYHQVRPFPAGMPDVVGCLFAEVFAVDAFRNVARKFVIEDRADAA